MKHSQQMKYLWEVSGLFHLLKMFHLLVKNVSCVVFHLFISRTGAMLVLPFHRPLCLCCSPESVEVAGLKNKPSLQLLWQRQCYLLVVIKTIVVIPNPGFYCSVLSLRPMVDQHTFSRPICSYILAQTYISNNRKTIAKISFLPSNYLVIT